MWGKLLVINLETLSDHEPANPTGCAQGMPIDEILLLPDSTLQGEASAAEESYWATLELCASLGMIQGHGLPSKQDWAPDHVVAVL